MLKCIQVCSGSVVLHQKTQATAFFKKTTVTLVVSFFSFSSLILGSSFNGLLQCICVVKQTVRGGEGAAGVDPDGGGYDLKATSAAVDDANYDFHRMRSKDMFPSSALMFADTSKNSFYTENCVDQEIPPPSCVGRHQKTKKKYTCKPKYTFTAPSEL